MLLLSWCQFSFQSGFDLTTHLFNAIITEFLLVLEQVFWGFM